MSKNVPTWEAWLNISEDERRKIHLEWDVYGGEGRELAEKVLARFKVEYGNIQKLKIFNEPTIDHGGIWAIAVEYPFIFDKRIFPNSYLGIEIKGGTLTANMPPEFLVEDETKEYVWAPERYEAFVDRCSDEVMRELGRPDMSQEEMLSALCGRDFKKHVQQCKEWEEKGLIPPYKYTKG